MSRVTPGEIPSWVYDWSDERLRARFAHGTFARGLGYATLHAVRIVKAGGDPSILLAQVAGSERTPYQTVVTSPGRFRVQGRCSCPVASDCKHVVATVLTARDQGVAAPTAFRSFGQPGWTDLLGDVVAPNKYDEPAPLALSLEIVQPRNGGPRRVRIRPLAEGKNGWVKTGASWHDLEQRYYGYRDTPPNAEQTAWARETLALVRSRAQNYYGSTYGDLVVHLDEFGPAVWRVLADAQRVGFTLVEAHGGSVEIVDEPARAVADLQRRADGAMTVTTTLRHNDGQPLPGDVVLIGDPAYGAAVTDEGGLRLIPLDPAIDGSTQRLVTAGPVVVPEHDLSLFLTDFYPALSRRVTVVSDDDSVDLPEIAPPLVGLLVRFEEGHTATIETSFLYPVGEESLIVPVDSPDDDATRDLAAERDLLQRLDVLDRVRGLRVRTTYGYRLTPVVTLRGLDTAELVEHVLPALEEAESVEVIMIGEPAAYGEAAEAPLVTVAVRDRGDDPDWFDLDVAVTVDGQNVPFAPLFAAIALGEERLLLDSGTWFRLDRPELRRLRDLIEEAKALEDRPSDSLRLTPVQAGLFDELVQLGVVTEQSERWSRSAGALLALEELPHPDPPAGLRAELRPYQLEGYQWLSLLWDLRLGGVLADDMGLGKTVQTLAMAARAKADGSLGGEAGPLLVVTPTSVMATWASQAATFCPDLDVRVIPETEKKSKRTIAAQADGADLVVTSFALFRIDEEAHRSVRWSGLVLDEAQFVKNHQAKTYQCARRLPAPFKLAITGTPLENSLMDLWSMLSIVAPGLFPDPQRFKEFFQRPIESGRSPERLDALRRRVRPLMLRRTKDLVATDLPPKTEQVLDVSLNPQHRRIYDTHLNRERQRVLRLVADMDKNRITILQSLTTLRQLTLDAALVDEDYAGKCRSSKIDVLVEQLREVAAEGHRALVFSQFTRFLSTVRTRLTEEGIGSCYLDGRTRDRQQRIAEFTEGDAPVFLISLKAGGFGLNLTEADYVYILDPWWNPAAEEQAIDRTHRIGQDKPVMVYRLVATDTIEQKVIALQQRKRDLFAAVVDGGAASSGALTAEDVRELFAS
jgi:superfamily II DNA or RNA helicase